MKIECSVNKIKYALGITERLTGKNLTLPVLGSILITAEGKSVSFRSTNLSIGAEILIPAKVDKEGVVAIRGDVLQSFFSSLGGDENVFMEVIETSLVVKTKKNTVTIKTVSHEDFPTLPVVEGEDFILPASKIIEGLESVVYSASLSDIKPEIGSVYIYPENDTLVFVATDSFRLSEKKVKIKKTLSFNGILLPAKNAMEIIKIFSSLGNEDVNIILSKNQIAFNGGGVYLTSRVVDGIFPDYKQIIPKSSNTQVVVLKQDLLNALKIANIFSDKFNQTTFSINPSEKFFEIQSKNNDVGENNSVVTATLSGDEVVVNFNYKYIVESFNSIHTDSVSLDLSGNNKPMIIKPISDASFMYLVMPMNR